MTRCCLQSYVSIPGKTHHCFGGILMTKTSQWHVFSMWLTSLYMCIFCVAPHSVHVWNAANSVCVWTICKDVKFLTMQGGSARLTDTAQRRHCQFVVIQSLISSAYLHQFFISLNGNRLSQVPACRCFQQFSNHCTVFAIWFTADFVRWNSCF